MTVPAADLLARKEAFEEAKIETVVDAESVHTPHTDPWIQEIFGVMEPILGEKIEPRGAPYFTDASALTPAYGHPPTIILGPGEMKMAHPRTSGMEASFRPKSSAAWGLMLPSLFHR